MMHNNYHVNNTSTTITTTNGPVARWLETFQCRQYVDVFEAYGYNTLQQVCQLNVDCLASMGVLSIDCEKILENVFVLRQTLQASSSNSINSQPITISPTNSGKQKKSYNKAKSSSKQQQQQANLKAPPNVTMHGNQMYPSYNSTSNRPSQENARYIANDILNQAKNVNSNSTYTCVPFTTKATTVNSYLPTTTTTTYKNSPLQSLERLVSLPETQVVDPKSVVNDSNLLYENEDNTEFVNNNKKRLYDDDSVVNGSNGTAHNKKLYQTQQQLPQSYYPYQQPQQEFPYYSNSNYYQNDANYTHPQQQYYYNGQCQEQFNVMPQQAQYQNQANNQQSYYNHDKEINGIPQQLQQTQEFYQQQLQQQQIQQYY